MWMRNLKFAAVALLFASMFKFGGWISEWLTPPGMQDHKLVISYLGSGVFGAAFLLILQKLRLLPGAARRFNPTGKD